MIEFTVRGAPQPRGSTRAFPFRRKDGGIGVHVTDTKAASLAPWMAAVREAARRAANEKLLDGPLRVHIEFSFVRPKSVSPRKRPQHTVRPDLDKLVRAVLDACTGVVWRDDAQVVELCARKNYGATFACRATVAPEENDEQGTS